MIACSIFSSFACSINEREVTIVFNSMVLRDEINGFTPNVKLSIAGILSAYCKAKKLTTLANTFGSISPILFSLAKAFLYAVPKT